ncbi:putative bifunctional diguanylate cyclase/phosphodiesterase [Halomonas sp. NCCP-2165]|nr:bifunctional diguanylate cyclase/phosphodiesterase [Halomonas sp. NCCP-2165]GKW48206.1 hypothetical protein NCCP2165_04210 [Halomonas sp. NCCP-2165]
MNMNSRHLGLQAWLLILLISSFLIGVTSLLIDLWGYAPLPPQWRLSTDGAIAVVLASMGLLALLGKQSRWRYPVGGLLLTLGGYCLGHYLLVPATDSGLSGLTGYPRLSPLPASLVLVMGSCCFLPPRADLTRIIYRLFGGLALGIGAFTLAYPLTLDTPPISVWGITSMGGLFFLLLGASLLVMVRLNASPTPPLPRAAIAVGILGATVSIVIWLVSSWIQYNARVAEADKLVNNISLGIAQHIESRVEMIARLKGRWMALRERPIGAVRHLQQLELRSYLEDEPSLKAIAFLGPDLQPQWQMGREPEDLLWLTDQLTAPETLDWLHQQDDVSQRTRWYFPDPENSGYGVLSISLDGGLSTMVATLDLTEVIQMVRHLNTDGFTIHYSSEGKEWGMQYAHDWHESISPRSFASRQSVLAGGPTLTVTALDGPLSLTSLPGALPVVFGLVGLGFTHLLIISCALALIRDAQAVALRRSEQRFRSLFSQHPDAVFAHSRDGIYESLNPMAEVITGIPEKELVGRPIHSIICEPACSKQDIQDTESAFLNAASGVPSSYTMRLSLKGRPSQDLEVTMVPIVVNDEIDGVFGIIKDITKRVLAEERLHVLERSLEASSNGAVIVDVREEEKPVIYVNPAFTRITGYREQEVIGAPLVFLNSDKTSSQDIQQIQAALYHGRSLSTTIRVYRRDGTPFWNQLFLSPVHDAQQQITHFVGIMNDISERKEQESQLAYQATHDVLTGLGNRALFSDRLSHDVDLATRNGQTLAVLFIDLDEFKPVNDTLGHKVGDRLLISVAERLRQGRRASDTLARLGGDEFVLLLPDLSGPGEAEEVADRLLKDLDKPHRIGEHELHVSASIGIATNHGGIHEPERLLQHADIAMYQAKQQGRNAYQSYTEDLDSQLSQRVILRSELQEAIECGHLDLYYQPLINREGHVDGLEALVRWPHPTRGFISPATFIPIAEETGQIIPLSRWVIRKACQDARRLVDQGLLRGRVAVNQSPLHFHRPNFLDTLRDALCETGLPATHLELELTEGILMRNAEGAIDILHALSDMGITTAIDDFGTGYSSLSYLRDLPIDKIKIDRSFVQDANSSDKNAAICQGVITLAQQLDLKVVAEGIETAEQHDYLMSLGCEVFQGYLFARPMPLDDLTRWLSKQVHMPSSS